MPEAGRATGGAAGCGPRGVTPVTMPSAIPYSSGSAPATTPPVSLMCSTPGPISLACSTIVCTISEHSSRFPAIRVSSDPTQNRYTASPAISRTMSITVRTTSSVMS